MPIEGHVSICPIIFLFSQHPSKHLLEGPIETFYKTIALGMIYSTDLL